MLKKTLLLTSALASVALISTASFAELKVSATQEWEFSSANLASTSTNNKLLGSQTDLNLKGGGDLGNGNSYTTSYAISNAGHDTVQANLKMGGVDIELGQNGSIGVEDVKAIVPFVNNRANDVAGTTTISYDVTDLSSGKSYIGANFAAGSAGAISVGYNPNMGNGKTTGTDAGIAGGTLSTGSAFTASFKGSLGVDGLTVGVGVLEGSNANSVNDDVASLTYGVAYNFGSISVGAQHIENTGDAAKTATSETIVDNYGVAFAASDSISLGLYRSDSKKEVEGVAGNKMESTILQIGYKLGAAKVSYDYVSSDNYAHSATNDVTLHKVKLMMAF
mgnify:FL=1